MNTNDAENTIVIKKRKIELASEQKDQRKKYASAVVGIDDQAEESDEDSSNDEDEEEDDTNYVIDDFLVPDAEDDSDDDTSNQDDNESASDDEDDDEAKLQRLKKRKDDVQLDEEDELLIKEYEANLVTEDIKKDVLNKKDIDEDHIGDEILPTVASKDEDEDSFERDALVFDAQTKARHRSMYLDDDEDSDMGGFIVQDDDDDDENAADENNIDRDAQVSRRHVAVPRVRAGKRDGPSYDQIQEAIDIFGAGYDDFDDDDNEDGDNDELENTKETASPLNKSTDGILLLSKKDQKRVTKLRGRFERSQLVATFCTERDDDIRRIDKPERLQEVLKGREIPQEPERQQEARWMSTKLALKMIEDNIYIDNRLSDYEKQEKLAEELVEPILIILRFFQLEQFEVPFIWSYRRDYLHPLMTRAHLWKLFLMEEDWDTMYSTKIRLINQVQALVDAANVINKDEELEMVCFIYIYNI